MYRSYSAETVMLPDSTSDLVPSAVRREEDCGPADSTVDGDPELRPVEREQARLPQVNMLEHREIDEDVQADEMGQPLRVVDLLGDDDVAFRENARRDMIRFLLNHSPDQIIDGNHLNGLLANNGGGAPVFAPDDLFRLVDDNEGDIDMNEGDIDVDVDDIDADMDDIDMDMDDIDIDLGGLFSDDSMLDTSTDDSLSGNFSEESEYELVIERR